MADSAVVTLTRQFKADLLRGEKAQMAEMAQRWLAVERRLSGEMSALAYEMDGIKRDGGTVTQDLLFNQVRYRELLGQLTDELETYTDYAERTIEDRQRQLARLGITHAERAITAQGVTGGFSRLPIEAVQHLVGMSGDGSPLRNLLVASWPASAQGMTQELINGVALGYNPRKTAKMMAQGAQGSQQRMEVIARTETLRTYRSASLESYRTSQVVTSYKRLSARDSRVCAGCLAADGEEYALDVEFKSHPQCRCTTIPQIRGVPIRYQTGAEWFDQQPATTQLEILGKGRYKLWAMGDVTNFKEFMTIRPSAIWGDSIVTTPLGELV